jgi:hypothetical protein
MPDPTLIVAFSRQREKGTECSRRGRFWVSLADEDNDLNDTSKK